MIALATLTDAGIGIVLALLQVVISLVFALSAVYIGIRVFDRFTKNIDEMEELKRGNIAIGILLAAVIISIATVIQGGVRELTAPFFGGGELSQRLVGFLGGVIQLLISLALALFVIRMAIYVFDRITEGIDEQEELRRGNVAIAILLAGILIAIATVIQSGTAALGDSFRVLGDALFGNNA
ncbi:MAG TPA: DUF350 domain-containing protein [Candidatus Thermoplasmatota archaeon]|nr:DUF350 domain-containing protein [Candidatus Thermoplasmatota archaeon]